MNSSNIAPCRFNASSDLILVIISFLHHAERSLRGVVVKGNGDIVEKGQDFTPVGFQSGEQVLRQISFCAPTAPGGFGFGMALTSVVHQGIIEGVVAGIAVGRHVLVSRSRRDACPRAGPLTEPPKTRR